MISGRDFAVDNVKDFLIVEYVFPCCFEQRTSSPSIQEAYMFGVNADVVIMEWLLRLLLRWWLHKNYMNTILCEQKTMTLSLLKFSINFLFVETYHNSTNCKIWSMAAVKSVWMKRSTFSFLCRLINILDWNKPSIA